MSRNIALFSVFPFLAALYLSAQTIQVPIGPTMKGYQVWQGSRACYPVDSFLINYVSGTSFTLPVSVTFSNIWFSGCAADATPNSGAAIIYITGPNVGTPICHNTHPVAIVNGATAIPCSEGTVTLPPGEYALVWTTSSTKARIYLQSSGNVAPVLMGVQSITGCSASNGVIDFTTPCNTPITPFIDNSDFPNMMLY